MYLYTVRMYECTHVCMYVCMYVSTFACSYVSCARVVRTAPTHVRLALGTGAELGRLPKRLVLEPLWLHFGGSTKKGKGSIG